MNDKEKLEKVRGEIFDLIASPPCGTCDYWTVPEHYCHLKTNLYPQLDRCDLLKQILSRVEIASDDQSLPENPYEPPLDDTQEGWRDVVEARTKQMLKERFIRVIDKETFK